MTAAAPPPPTFAIVKGSTLTVTGTSGNEILTSTLSGRLVQVHAKRREFFGVRDSAVTKIVVNLLAGNDSYSSATQLDIKQTINGGRATTCCAAESKPT